MRSKQFGCERWKVYVYRALVPHTSCWRPHQSLPSRTTLHVFGSWESLVLHPACIFQNIFKLMEMHSFFRAVARHGMKCSQFYAIAWYANTDASALVFHASDCHIAGAARIIHHFHRCRCHLCECVCCANIFVAAQRKQKRKLSHLNRIKTFSFNSIFVRATCIWRVARAVVSCCGTTKQRATERWRKKW